MKERAYIYAGETVVLRFEARKEGQILDLSGYDVEIDIATTAMGTHLVKQSAKGEVDISQAARGMLLCTLSAEDTGSLTPGTATIGVRLLHDTFVRMGFDASIEVLRQGATPGAVLSRTAQPVITLHTPCIWVYMDFAATRGDDGITPHIGENGNWFIGDEDTGERALGVTYDDLTPEQIEELQRPATEAAIEANKAAQAAKNATESATTATEGAVAAAAMANTATGAATTATTAANRAAAEATAAAGNATTAATEADDAATAANAAAASATGAATAANDAAGAANAAAEDATHAAESVGTAAEDAASAAKAANAATEAATTATTAANNAAAEATAATGNATTAATEATNAANAANIAAEGIDGKIAGKADLDPATGYIKSSQIAPLEGRQTGVKTGNGGFVSTDPALCLSTAKTLVVTFKCDGTPDSFLYFDHGGSNANLGVSIFIASNRLFCNIGPKTLVSFNPESGKLYQVVVSFDKNGTSAGYMNSVKDRETTDYSTITDPTHFCLGALSDGSGSFSGVILGARLFNYALTASEVATLWNGGEPERYMLPLSGEMRTGLVAEYIAAGLLADKWRDTSGAGLDLPYVPTATGGTAVFDYRQRSGDSDTFTVLAASDCSLEARVTTLERTLVAVLSGAAVIPELQVRELGVWGPNNLILTGSGAPTKAPDRAGQFYIDTASGAVYKSTGNAAVADWKNL
nr:MAG TPA: Concanavalin A-like lectin/glucanase superfamily protein [Caudoviricetes sp.]